MSRGFGMIFPNFFETPGKHVELVYAESADRCDPTSLIPQRKASAPGFTMGTSPV